MGHYGSLHSIISSWDRKGGVISSKTYNRFTSPTVRLWNVTILLLISNSEFSSGAAFIL